MTFTVRKRSSEVSTAHTRRERLLRLLESRTQAQPPWTVEELAEQLHCSVPTVKRALAWLRDFGKLPPVKQHHSRKLIPAGSPRTNFSSMMRSVMNASTVSTSRAASQASTPSVAAVTGAVAVPDVAVAASASTLDLA